MKLRVWGIEGLEQGGGGCVGGWKCALRGGGVLMMIRRCLGKAGKCSLDFSLQVYHE